MSQEHCADPGRPQDTRLAHSDCRTRAGWGFAIQVSKRKAPWHVCMGSSRTLGTGEPRTHPPRPGLWLRTHGPCSLLRVGDAGLLPAIL